MACIINKRVLMRFYYKPFITFFIIILTFVLPSTPSFSMGDDQAEIAFVKTIKVQKFGKKSIESLLYVISEREGSNDNDSKGILGEVAAITLFGIQGYEILENAARRFIGCELTSKKGKAGIDGIFLQKNAVPVFNEAKYRAKGCKNSDLPYASYGQEMSPEWVSYHFSHLRDQDMTRSPQCAGIDFDNLAHKYQHGNVMRTMTCLKENGEIDLYYVIDMNAALNQQAIGFLSSITDFDITILIKYLNDYLRPE